MPHSRPRHALAQLLKKLKYSPVVALQGARQTGKSFLVRDLLSPHLEGLVYRTFDQISVRRFASDNPETFLLQNEDAHPLAIDEAQKVADIFDAVKHQVDSNRKPGRFLLLGSTEFSKMLRIRESLTGRLSRLRLYPLTAAECLELPLNPASSLTLVNSKPRCTRSQLLRHLEKGGMPAIFSLRSRAEIESAQRDWIQLTVERDANGFPGVKTDADLLVAILEAVAKIEMPEAARIARHLGANPRRVMAHIKVLETLFVLHSLAPSPLGVGKTRYFLCDSGLARALGADFERQLYTWVLGEHLATRGYRGIVDEKIFYHQTRNGSLIHLLVEGPKGFSGALKILPRESADRRDIASFAALESTRQKNLHCVLLSGTAVSAKIDGVDVRPWEALA